MKAAAPGALPTALVLVVLLSFWGAALVLVAFDASRLYSVPMLLGTLFPLVLYASRNPRLFLFDGMIATAVFGLSINFFNRTHAGGAQSLAIDLMDFFMLPLVAFLVRDFAQGYRRDFRLSAVSGWWAASIALGLVSVVVGPFRDLAALEVVRMLKCWLLFVIVINECVREKHFHHVAMSLAVAVLVNVLLAFAQFALKRSLGLEALGEPAQDTVQGANFGVYLSAESVFRVSGIVAHPNVFAAYLALLLPIFIALLFTSYGPVLKFGLAALCLAGLAALLLTLSRAGWADFAAGFVLLLAILFAHPALRHRFAVMKLGLLVCTGLALLAAAGMIVTRLTKSDSGALDFRWEWIGVAWRMVQAKPVFGFGLNSFWLQILDYSPYSVGRLTELFGPVWPVVHNVYFIYWSEQGTIGLLLFLGLNLHVFWLGMRNLRQSFSDKVMMFNIGAMCGMVALAVDGLASFYLRVPAPARVYWIVTAMVVAAHYWNRYNAPLRQARHADEAMSNPSTLPAVLVVGPGRSD